VRSLYPACFKLVGLCPQQWPFVSATHWAAWMTATYGLKFECQWNDCSDCGMVKQTAIVATAMTAVNRTTMHHPHCSPYIGAMMNLRQYNPVAINERHMPNTANKVTHRSFRQASPHLWNQLPTSLRIPHPNYSSPSQRPSFEHAGLTCYTLLSTSITFSLFHSELKTYLFRKSYPPP